MSEVITDKLTGRATAGDVTITSEGGAATMQLQQGVAKTWINFNGTGTIATRDSLNVSSLVDNGTGQYFVYSNNDFGNANYTAVVAQGNNSASNPGTTGSVTAGHTGAGVSGIETSNSSSGSNNDWAQISGAYHGDLA